MDAEREAKIASLLAADPNLRYSKEIGKFYQLVTATSDWTTASSDAMATSLNGVSGQVVTIYSAAENEIIAALQATAGADLWIGASDQSVEGEWRWQNDGSDGDQFWSGTATGYNVGGHYQNWASTDPDAPTAGDDYARIRTGGLWADRSNSYSYGHVVEWDADAVLDATQALTYSVVSQTAAGAFAINADSGVITVADGSLLDYETNATHTLTIRVTDVEGNTRDEAFTISLNNLAESNTAPTNLSSGIELNTDGGNDAYLTTSNGGAIFGGLTSFTFETQFQATSAAGNPPLLSYEVGTGNTNTVVIDAPAGNLRLSLARTSLSTSYPYSNLVDGEPQLPPSVVLHREVRAVDSGLAGWREDGAKDVAA